MMRHQHNISSVKCSDIILLNFAGHAVDGQSFEFVNEEPFINLVHHSDNANHFKSGKMMHFWSAVKESPPQPPPPLPTARPRATTPPSPPRVHQIHTSSTPDLHAQPQSQVHPLIPQKQLYSLIFVEFGCAGHGKGPWDGLGAVIKQRIRKDILHNNIRTQSGKITSAAEVAEHLRAVFCTKEWREEHVDQTIKEVVVLYSDASAIEERANAERYAYDTLEGEKSTFSFMPLAIGVLGMREQSHWCPACCRARGRGLGSMNSLLQVGGCLHESQWREQECQRRDRAGIAERRVVAQREGKRLASKLKPGMWFASEDRLEADTFYIGQGFEVSPGSCIYKQVPDSVRTLIIAGTRFDRSDIVVAVQWWAKAVGVDLEERTYERWEASSDDKSKYGLQTNDGRTFFVINATELRMIDEGQTKFCMERVERANSIRPVNVTTRCASRALTARNPPLLVRLPVDTENNILARCWQG